MIGSEGYHFLDIVVANCAPIAIARWIHKEFGLSRPVRFPRFGTYHLVGEEVEVEIARLMDGPDEDASRRDFTINCLYVDLVHYSRTGRLEILDPTGYGIDDLEHARLRTPSEPALCFWLDPLRLIRAIRFRAVFGMKIDASLRHEIARMAYLVSRPARERIRAELERVASELSLDILGCVPFDEHIAMLDLLGKPMENMEDGSVAFRQVREMAEKLNLTGKRSTTA